MRRALLLLVALAAGCAALPQPRSSPYHRADADVSVTRIVHGSAIVEMRDTRVLVDPWFHASWITRHREPLGLVPEALPELAAVLLTHTHRDHFDPHTLRDLARAVPLAVGPPRTGARLRDLGFRTVVELGWWERTTVGRMVVTAVPADHAVRENGYVLETDGVTLYAAGDTRWFDELVDVATRFPDLDVALLPVGGLRLLGVRREMGPADAARATALLKPRRVIPIGYGARSVYPLWWYAWSPVDRFREAAGEAGIGPERIVVLEPGESWHYVR
jgi:L-ascorbate metabolism protein UlaG (beta-lactamase superfamily)